MCIFSCSSPRYILILCGLAPPPTGGNVDVANGQSPLILGDKLHHHKPRHLSDCVYSLYYLSMPCVQKRASYVATAPYASETLSLAYSRFWQSFCSAFSTSEPTLVS